MYCPKCGQGMFIVKSRINTDFECINSECNTMLRLILDKDGFVRLDENIKGGDN